MSSKGGKQSSAVETEPPKVLGLRGPILGLVFLATLTIPRAPAHSHRLAPGPATPAPQSTLACARHFPQAPELPESQTMSDEGGRCRTASLSAHLGPAVDLSPTLFGSSHSLPSPGIKPHRLLSTSGPVTLKARWIDARAHRLCFQPRPRCLLALWFIL